MAAGSEGAFSDQLERWLRQDEPQTLESLSHVFAKKGFAVTVLFLMFVPATPLPTGGITHVFEAITVAVAAQMVAGRPTLWLPARWRSRELGASTTEKALPFMIKWVRRFERFSRPRGVGFYRRRWSSQVLGLLLIAFAIAAGLAPPFSGLDTLPALGAVAVALSIILEDVVVLAVGIALGTGGVALTIAVGAALARAVRSLL